MNKKIKENQIQEEEKELRNPAMNKKFQFIHQKEEKNYKKKN